MLTYLALHGFTQRGSMWAEVAALAGGQWVTPDLPGHGGRPPRPWEETVASLAGLLRALPAPRCLVGYSMGGRLALAVALDYPGLVDRLAVVSASPGVADPEARERRLAEDLALAGRIEDSGVDAFLEQWLSRPLFGGLAARGPQWRQGDRAARLGSTAAGLAGALRLLGQGAQPYLGDRLGELEMPVLLMAGGDDRKYAALAEDMGRRLPRAMVAVAPGAGHALVGERPGDVAALLAGWSAPG
ncbi:MAG: alpha/beta fold hydrolase [Acidimicrobiia bacterium]|nr:alpha/beta fold hydrolase [Acidimicrobiia bacterium]